ncbi:hypothetical protein H4219_003912 [Mycoemilia scoparia]|uniref:Uncharacterized protein n=1 Tax=Mycoemilia scoparia TaxID=417184 RepID=A0A9W7ZU60_9FUNG|nr:hypothetical protein H4219_003912 [Mycoemilia scoparia]
MEVNDYSKSNLDVADRPDSQQPNEAPLQVLENSRNIDDCVESKPNVEKTEDKQKEEGKVEKEREETNGKGSEPSLPKVEKDKCDIRSCPFCKEETDNLFDYLEHQVVCHPRKS